MNKDKSIMESLGLTAKQIDQLEKEIRALRIEEEIAKRESWIKKNRRLVGRAFVSRPVRKKNGEAGSYWLVLDSKVEYDGYVQILCFDYPTRIRRHSEILNYARGREDLYSAVDISLFYTDVLKINGDGTLSRIAGHNAEEIEPEQFWLKAQETFDQVRLDLERLIQDNGYI